MLPNPPPLKKAELPRKENKGHHPKLKASKPLRKGAGWVEAAASSGFWVLRAWDRGAAAGGGSQERVNCSRWSIDVTKLGRAKREHFVGWEGSCEVRNHLLFASSSAQRAPSSQQLPPQERNTWSDCWLYRERVAGPHVLNCSAENHLRCHFPMKSALSDTRQAAEQL